MSPTVKKLLDDTLTSEAQKQELALFHGQWERIKEPSIAQKAWIALAKGDYDAAELRDAATPVLLRAEAAFFAGRLDEVESLLKEETSPSATVLRTQALELRGQIPQATALLLPWRETVEQGKLKISSAAELTAAAKMLIQLARLQGRPSQDYQRAIALLASARQDVDSLYWPARIVEAQILDEKDNPEQAAQAVSEALSLNLRAAAAWQQLGEIAIDGFNFDLANGCIRKLREISPQHPVALILESKVALTQRDPVAARAAAQALLTRYPLHREGLVLLAASEALAFDDVALKTALAKFDALCPNNPQALFLVGKTLSLARQYAASEKALRGAIERSPNWPAPHIELGLLLMQAGDEPAARTELAIATKLDPFNRRAANQYKLVCDLLDYQVIRSEHFIIKFHEGPDRVLAMDMPEELEKIYGEITSIFGHRPPRLTLIEILPDEQHFGIRITGMPEIWTIGASTGDVIAITPPRPGAKQRGAFDWARVIRHEFVHTVTLSQTNNRVPHWFTEACAVSQEAGGRDDNTCQLLASAVSYHKLFALDQINWAFVRPKNPAERPLAYAQANWMLEYITKMYGHSSVLKLLDLYRQGVSDAAAIEQVTGRNAVEFLSDFTAWATQQVRSWGLGPQDGDAEILPLIKQPEALKEKLDELLKKYPQHPVLLHAAAERALNLGDAEAARNALLRYAQARPTDLWTHRELITMATSLGLNDESIGSLEQLDRIEQLSGYWAFELAKIHRATGRLDAAMDAVKRALFREPYNATYRELAATLALQRSDFSAALTYLQGLAILEPDRAQHQVRLAALYYKLEKFDEANAAANAALKIDPKAPVQRFMKAK